MSAASPSVRLDSDADQALSRLAALTGWSKVKMATSIIIEAVNAIEHGQRGELATVAYLREKKQGNSTVTEDPRLIDAIEALRLELRELRARDHVGSHRLNEPARDYGREGPSKSGARSVI